MHTATTTQRKLQYVPLHLCTSVNVLVGGKNTVNASCRGSRPTLGISRNGMQQPNAGSTRTQDQDSRLCPCELHLHLVAASHS